jgi:hypothetical protein
MNPRTLLQVKKSILHVITHQLQATCHGFNSTITTRDMMQNTHLPDPPDNHGSSLGALLQCLVLKKHVVPGRPQAPRRSHHSSADIIASNPLQANQGRITRSHARASSEWTDAIIAI